MYKRLQQPLCDILMQKQDNGQSPTQVQLIFDITVQLLSDALQIPQNLDHMERIQPVL